MPYTKDAASQKTQTAAQRSGCGLELWNRSTVTVYVVESAVVLRSTYMNIARKKNSERGWMCISALLF